MENELNDYDYELPRELIAQEPVMRRADARMMLIHRETGSIEHYHVRDLPNLMGKGNTFVVNDSKVIPARLIGKRASTSGRWEGLFLREEVHGVAELLYSTRGTVHSGESIVLQDREGRDETTLLVVSPPQQGQMLVRCENPIPWNELLEKCGRVPLPPYIRDGTMIDADRIRYQTVYARNPGSIAAPTAGLHFTTELISELRAAGQALVSVTLHVGMGTFRPIKTERLEDHRMHSERGEISDSVAKRLEATRAANGKVIAVGTTTVRVLESAALAAEGRLQAWKGETDLFIKPGFHFAAVDGLLTNFHLPKSSLIVMVSAFAGRELVRKAYREAIREEYRFYSYGDCMLII